MSLSSSKPKSQDRSKPADGNYADDNDILFGMKSISNVLNRSYPTIIKFMQEYDDFPVRRDNGKGYVASRAELTIWFRAYSRGEK